MNFKTKMKTAAALASVTVFAVCAPAQEEEAATEQKGEETPAAVEQNADAAAFPQLKVADKFFYPLLRCRQVSGTVQVLRPTTTDWVDAEAGRFYPLGSLIRGAGDAKVSESGKAPAEVVFAFGEKCLLKFDNTNPVEFTTRPIKIGERVRTLVLQKGRVNLALPLQLKEGLFKVEAPYFTCGNLAGESWFDYSSAADGDTAEVRCVTGTMAITGKHYTFPRLVAANQLRITTTGKNLFTELVGESGDCKAQLDQGILAERNFETGEMVESVKKLEFSLSPQCAVRIFRAISQVGGRTAVSMMTFNAAGEMRNRVAFAEGRSNVNSGELVISTKAADADKAAAKSKIDEETEAVEVKPAEEKKAVKADKAEEPDEPAADKKDEKKDDKKDDDDLI